jgi:hypothetical protein
VSLRSKVLALMLGVFALYADAEFVVQRQVLLPGFVRLERATATSNMERALGALQREADLLIPPGRGARLHLLPPLAEPVSNLERAA